MMILVENLRKDYGRTQVLRDLSFSARAGEITLLVGPNGAGKTTTLKILAGLTRADGGTARVGSFDIGRDRIKAQRVLSYLSQRPNFHARLTCAQIVHFYARLRGLAVSRCEAVLDHAGLREFQQMRTGSLSGGTRQRLGLALLLLPDAPVLLLDEPGLSLDPGWRKRLQETLQSEAARGKTVLVTTHLIAEWNHVAHRCLLCHEGKVTRELDPANLPHDFDDVEKVATAPGSARVPRAGFGVPPKQSFLNAVAGECGEFSGKSAMARTPSPARGTRALPGGAR